MTEGTFNPGVTDPAAMQVDPAAATAPPPPAPDPAATVPPPDPAVTMPPPPPAEPVEPVVDPTMDPAATAAAPAEPVVDEAVQAPPAEPTDEAAEPPPLADGDGDGVAGEYGDGPDADGNGIPDEIGINPDSMRVEDIAEDVGDPSEAATQHTEEGGFAGEPLFGDDSVADFEINDFNEPIEDFADLGGLFEEPPTEPFDLGPPPPLDLSDRIDLDSAAVDGLSARQFLEVQDLLKDTANLSDPSALEDLDPGQMQLVIQALAGHVNDPGGDLGLPDDFSIVDLCNPDAPGPTLDPSLIQNLGEGQMQEVTQALGGSEGQPDLNAIKDLSPEQVQTVVQAFLGYMGTPGANVVEQPEAEVAEPLDTDDAVTNLEDAIASGDQAEISDAIEDLKESIRDTQELDSSDEGTIGTSRSALTIDDSDDDGGPAEVVDVSDAIEDFTDFVFDTANFLDDKPGESRDFGAQYDDAIDVSKDPDSPFDQDGKQPFDLDLTANESSGPAAAAAAGAAGAAGMVNDVDFGDFQDAAGNISDIGGIIDDPSGAVQSGFFDLPVFDVSRDILSTGSDAFDVLENPTEAAEEIIDGGVQDAGEAAIGNLFGGGLLGGPILGGIGAVGGFEVAGDVGEVVGDVVEDIPIVGDAAEAVGDVAEDVGDFFGF